MPGKLRHLLHRYLPDHFHGPVGLAGRILKSGDPAARFAMMTAAMGLLSTPLDVLLSYAERRLYRRAKPGRQPLIFICGPPRSGTTLVYQVLVQHLPVAYFSNLTVLFPRAPLTATRLFRRFLGRPRAGYDSFYGKTTQFSGTNDALYIWDRWLGADRARYAERLTADQETDLRQFFAACHDVFGRPLVNKNNNLNATAHLVADCLEDSYFLCLNRSRNDLAQSLYRARSEIHGSTDVPYGLVDQSRQHAASNSAVRSVCEQVTFFERISAQQEIRIGPQRFWNVCYEDFCRNPAALVERVAREILGDAAAVQAAAPTSFAISNQQRVSDEVAAEIEATFAEMAATHRNNGAPAVVRQG